jgi:hypothetical protein
VKKPSYCLKTRHRHYFDEHTQLMHALLCDMIDQLTTEKWTNH